MKTLCVAAVVVLSLTSGCRAASPACEKLLEPADKAPDLRGSWYLIAVSSQNCWFSALINAVALWTSFEVNITSKDTPNIYRAEAKWNTYGYCDMKSGDNSRTFFLGNNTFFLVAKDNTPMGQTQVLLQSGCPDCIVVNSSQDTVFLFSRRQNVTDAELMEFESQADCLGWFKPDVFNYDHDHKTCRSHEDEDYHTAVESFIAERMKDMNPVQRQCLTEFIDLFKSLFSVAG